MLQVHFNWNAFVSYSKLLNSLILFRLILMRKKCDINNYNADVFLIMYSAILLPIKTKTCIFTEDYTLWGTLPEYVLCINYKLVWIRSGLWNNLTNLYAKITQNKKIQGKQLFLKYNDNFVSIKFIKCINYYNIEIKGTLWPLSTKKQQLK